MLLKADLKDGAERGAILVVALGLVLGGPGDDETSRGAVGRGGGENKVYSTLANADITLMYVRLGRLAYERL